MEISIQWTVVDKVMRYCVILSCKTVMSTCLHTMIYASSTKVDGNNVNSNAALQASTWSYSDIASVRFKTRFKIQLVLRRHSAISSSLHRNQSSFLVYVTRSHQCYRSMMIQRNAISGLCSSPYENTRLADARNKMTLLVYTDHQTSRWYIPTDTVFITRLYPDGSHACRSK